MAADNALGMLFPQMDEPLTAFSFEEFHRRDELAKRKQTDFYDAINGDGQRILQLLKEYAEENSAAP